MASIFYLVCLVISTSSLVYLSQKKYKNSNIYLWSILLLIPIVVLGYWIKSTTHSPEAAMVSFCFIYLDSTVMPVILMFAYLKSIGKTANSWIKLTVYSITALHLFSIWISKDTKLYYDEITINETGMGTVTKMISGPLKFTHYVYLFAVILAFIIMLIYGFLQKGNGSKKSLLMYLVVVVSTIGVYVIEMVFDASFSVLPGLYAIYSVVITIGYENVQSHDIFNLIGERQAETGIRGFCAFDTRRNMLGYNKQFAGFLPDIEKVRVDEKISKSCQELYHVVNSAIDEYNVVGECSRKIPIGDRILQLIVSDFSVSYERRKNGYLLEISDITDDQKRLDTVEKYNERLSREVDEKTEHILEIQNSVVLGLANMVENRDDNTGGHVKRTSSIIKYLIEEIQRQKTYNISEEMAKDIVRAAPMHDLGKISIDSDILCKPARLTEDEYAIMKTHAPKSGEIVRIILEGVEEQHFVDVSYNVARHHHERWDGRGYPDGLMGESIPVEARIMAVSDVYDALVSKRCYKDSMSFEQAFKIMNECMGSQFDPAMRPVFVACREKLEAYYSQDL